MTGSVNVMKGLSLSALALGMTASPALAATTITWADLTSSTANSVDGTISVGSGVSVTYTGPYSFVQLSGGTNYWTGNAYTFDGDNHAPPTTDIIALGQGGTKTIKFSQTVSDVYLALISWNGNSGTFDQPFEIVSQGSGYWGSGAFNVSGGAPYTTFNGTGEPHGIIRFTGSFDEVTFTDLTENWHGIQIGIGGLAPPPTGAVPEPGTWAMMLAGFGLVGGVMRRRRRQSVRVHFA